MASAKDWAQVVEEAAWALEDLLDAVELMAEEEAEGTAEEGLAAHDYLEETARFLFDEVDRDALAVAMTTRGTSRG